MLCYKEIDAVLVAKDRTVAGTYRISLRKSAARRIFSALYSGSGDAPRPPSSRKMHLALRFKTQHTQHVVPRAHVPESVCGAPLKRHLDRFSRAFVAAQCPIYIARQTRQDSAVCVVSGGVN